MGVSPTPPTFRDGCLLAVNLGDDADTTAAIYGQIAGAYYGIDGIPAEWRERVAMGDLIIQLADGLWQQRRLDGILPPIEHVTCLFGRFRRTATDSTWDFLSIVP